MKATCINTHMLSSRGNRKFTIQAIFQCRRSDRYYIKYNQYIEFLFLKEINPLF